MRKSTWFVILSVFLGCQSGEVEDLAPKDRMEQAGPIIEEMFANLAGNPLVAQLWKEISLGTVRVDWGMSGNVVAGFNRDGGRETLLLNERYVRLAMGSDAERQRVGTYLVHEAVHHRQYHDHPLAPEIASCADWWLAEREAYEEQCSYARSSDVEAMFRKTCSTDHPDVFRHNLLIRLLHSGIDSRGAGCRSEFSALAELD